MAAYTITLSVFSEGTGTVTGAGVYEEGTSFTINAIPANGKMFDRWEMYYGGSWMNLDASQEFTWQMPPQNIELRAVFIDYVPRYVTVTISPEGAGTVVSIGEHTPKELVTLTPTPAAGYMFRWWDFNGLDNILKHDGPSPGVPETCDYEDNPLVFYMPNQDINITAIFVPIVEIRTAQELNDVRNDLTGKYYKQMADIDLSGYENWNPIGDYWGNDGEKFRAVYDFNGFAVKNLTINRPSGNYQGLFGYVEYDGIIKNARLKNPNIIGGYCTGALVGHHQREMLSKCIVTGGSVQCVDDWVGALFGWAVKVKECAAIDVDVSSTGSKYAGGLGGGLHSNFSNCYAFGGSVNGIKFIGGLIGFPSWTSGSEFSYAAVAVSGTQYPGGLCGRQAIGNTAPTSAYYDSEMSGQSDTGKGEPRTTAEMKTQATYEGWDFENVWAIDPSINDGYPCFQWQIPPPIEVWTAEDLNNVRNNLSGRYIQMADIDLSGYENWEPIGSSYVKFSGIYDGNGHEITNLTIAGENGLAGLFSVVLWATLKNINLRNVDISLNYGSRGDCYGGGLAALFLNSTATNCSITGDISVERFSENEGYVGEVFVGGLFGLCGSETPGTITDCLNACNVSCSVLVNGQNAAVSGGIVGLCEWLTITNCYNIGNISASSKNYMGVAGGLIGYGCPVEATNCFNRGNVSGEVLEVVIDDGACVVGGFSGLAIGKIINCYSTGSVSGVSPSNLEIGGLLGVFHNDEFYKEGEKSCVLSSYYDTQTSGQSDTGKGEPKTTAEMKQQATFVDWDFTDTWGIDPAKNDGYPYLQWQTLEEPHIPIDPGGSVSAKTDYRAPGSYITIK